MKPVIDPERFGISFSLKQCRNFGVDQLKALDWLLAQGWRRFRLTSYWDEHEPEQGTYDFKALDAQIRRITEAGGVFTLCLGARQPRWPENHWPNWAWLTTKGKRTEALLRYLEVVVDRYRDEPALIGYQLENEALLKSFGKRAEVDRPRLRAEFALIKRLDPVRPVIMSTSTSWGIPLRQPIPDIVGFSYYHV
ncbi:MAG TPA: beta-galactosidase, partial [Candidatus Saccharimonadales bacterium]|nr:beta-galactosidase [Candidatus Saccharimonadales bacterium]